MGYLLLACPKCHAAYKLLSEHAKDGVTCRQCGHVWQPSLSTDEAAASAPSAPPAAPPATSAKPADALAALAAEHKPTASASHHAPHHHAHAHPHAAPAAAAAPTPREEKVDPLVGTLVNGFKIQGRIGSGGFGVVYRAFDTNLERSVALKLLPPNLAKANAGLVERFLREARSAAKLSHPNIVTIHQICPFQDTFYIVMELVDGGALHEYLGGGKRFKPKEATRVIRAAAEGLGHAHLRGVIHRDIKPGNIMLTADGQVKVSDFGLARDVMQREDIVGPGHSLGTPRYMSPEQAMGEEPTAASDLYSLAATYFVLLTGRAPYDSTSDRDIMKMHVTAPIPDPREFVPSLPAAVFRFLEKAMAKDPDQRYQTAPEFIEALDRLDFSQLADDSALTPNAVRARLGQIASEDRGSHLSAVLGRAVKRAHRYPTPSPAGFALGATPQSAKGLTGWKLWLVAGVGLLLLIGAAVATALIIAEYRKAARSSAGGSTAPTVRMTPSGGRTPASQTPPAATPGAPTENAAAPETPTAPTPEGKPVAPPAAAPSSTTEAEAEAYLQDARKYEAEHPDAFIGNILESYQNVITMFPGTKAAQEAQKALDRLRGETGETASPAAAEEPAPSDTPAPEEPAPPDTSNE